ncbi:MAG TPA: hypothetical protein VKP11_12225 [Frankiaceae bacterium]|nr:hypothetical protein [Frankiaceae bacterium]
MTTGASLREMVRVRAQLRSLSDVRRYLGRSGRSAVEVLAGVRGPQASGATPEEVREAIAEVERWYPLVLLDCAAGWDHPVTAAATRSADALILVSRATAADLVAAEEALAALAACGRARLAATTLAAVVHTSRGGPQSQVRPQLARLAGRARAVVQIPYDPGLAAGRPITYARLRRRTRTGFLRLGVALVEQLAQDEGTNR